MLLGRVLPLGWPSHARKCCIDHGELFSDCVTLLAASDQITAIGVNCTEPHLVPSLLRTARQCTTKPLVCYPNSGEKYLNRPLRDGEAVHWAKTDVMRHNSNFVDAARIWHECGAAIIGGCCRITANDIAMLSELFPRLASAEATTLDADMNAGEKVSSTPIELILRTMKTSPKSE